MRTGQDNKRAISFTRGLSNSVQRRTHRALQIVLIIVILGVLGTLGYLITRLNVSDKITEFYALGVNDQATDYPSDFIMENGQVVSVVYGSLSTVYTEQWGTLTLSIVNHEGQDMTYSVTMDIDGTQVGIPFQGGTVDTIGPITLKPEEKWEQEIGIEPQHPGSNQEVEIFLYKDGGAEPYLNLDLWINVN